ncbi:MAG: hypothetical protein AAGF48_14740 [Pseudomonadota bacterium]
MRQYSSLYDQLHGLGYAVPNRPVDAEATRELVHEFDYDWRLSNFDNAALLKEFVDERIGGRRFDIVAHSMGGLIARLYIHSEGGAEQVDTLISMGVPHRGAVQSLRTADSGWSWWQNLLAGGINDIRATALTFPSLYEVLPGYVCCRDSNGPDAIAIMDPAVWIGFDDWLPPKFHGVEGQDFIASALKRGRGLQKIMQEPPVRGIRHCMIASEMLPTITQVRIGAGGAFDAWIEGRGDGTVPIFSATNGGDLSRAKPATTAHQTIFDNDAALQALRWCLIGIEEPTSAETGLRFALRGEAGVAVATGFSVKVEQDVLFAGHRGGVARVSFVGEPDLMEIGLSPDVSIWGSEGSTPLAALTDPSIDMREEDQEIVLTFVYRFEAPADQGAYSVAVKQNGLPHAIADDFLVIPRDAPQ